MKVVIVALELIFARVSIAPAIAEAGDHGVAAVEQHLGLERGGLVEERHERSPSRHSRTRLGG